MVQAVTENADLVKSAPEPRSKHTSIVEQSVPSWSAPARSCDGSIVLCREFDQLAEREPVKRLARRTFVPRRKRAVRVDTDSKEFLE
jgi:hypothetical protein